jgi:hypothetical protein
VAKSTGNLCVQWLKLHFTGWQRIFGVWWIEMQSSAARASSQKIGLAATVFVLAYVLFGTPG